MDVNTKIEIRIRRRGDYRNWDDIPVAFTTILDIDAVLLTGIAEDPNILALRWNVRGSMQGYYLSVSGRRLLNFALSRDPMNWYQEHYDNELFKLAIQSRSNEWLSDMSDLDYANKIIDLALFISGDKAHDTHENEMALVSCHVPEVLDFLAEFSKEYK